MAVAETRDKVQRILTKNLNSVEIDEDGDFRVRYGSTACFVSVKDWGDDESLVRLTAPILHNVPSNPDVYRWVATEGQAYFFGSTRVLEDYAGEDKDEDLTLVFDHTLLGDYLDEDELMKALIGVVTVADRLDDELKEQFGGRRLIED